MEQERSFTCYEKGSQVTVIDAGVGHIVDGVQDCWTVELIDGTIMEDLHDLQLLLSLPSPDAFSRRYIEQARLRGHDETVDEFRKEAESILLKTGNLNSSLCWLICDYLTFYPIEGIWRVHNTFVHFWDQFERAYDILFVETDGVIRGVNIPKSGVHAWRSEIHGTLEQNRLTFVQRNLESLESYVECDCEESPNALWGGEWEGSDRFCRGKFYLSRVYDEDLLKKHTFPLPLSGKKQKEKNDEQCSKK